MDKNVHSKVLRAMQLLIHAYFNGGFVKRYGMIEEWEWQ